MGGSTLKNLLPRSFLRDHKIPQNANWQGNTVQRLELLWAVSL